MSPKIIRSKKYAPKQLFLERMKKLLPHKNDYESYLKILNETPVNSIRCNTLKISPEKLISRLQKNHSWKIKQLFRDYPEIMIITSPLKPGEIGRSLEHLLGYYYVQEIASMLPVLALNPNEEDVVLDLASSPGSKTTQIAAKMNNKGTLIANEVSLGRIKILKSNLERCGVSNTIITKKEGTALCNRIFKETNLRFDKILIDAPCSGEGTIRSTPKTNLMWNINNVKRLSGIQTSLIESAIQILKPKGEIVYSTCTHSPEENEAVISHILEKHPDLKLDSVAVGLPKEIKCRPGIKKWEDKNFKSSLSNVCRIYPQDNNTEGFFISKLTKQHGH
jgi:NOL1/NOP2/sun family putative RNA methylase